MFEFHEGSLPVSRRRVYGLKKYVEQSINHLDGKDPNYFTELLPSDQTWRIFADFRSTTAYLDIETTGMGNCGDHITTVGLYDGKTIFSYVLGRNLDDFEARLQEYDVIVTYNGKCFDLPFIRTTLGIRMNQAHIDLRYVLKSLGFGGGLKRCEKELGIDLEALVGVDGFFAVLLWNDYERNGNPQALETLLAYNVQDVP